MACDTYTTLSRVLPLAGESKEGAGEVSESAARGCSAVVVGACAAEGLSAVIRASSSRRLSLLRCWWYLRVDSAWVCGGVDSCEIMWGWVGERVSVCVRACACVCAAEERAAVMTASSSGASPCCAAGETCAGTLRGYVGEWVWVGWLVGVGYVCVCVCGLGWRSRRAQRRVISGCVRSYHTRAHTQHVSRGSPDARVRMSYTRTHAHVAYARTQLHKHAS